MDEILHNIEGLVAGLTGLCWEGVWRVKDILHVHQLLQQHEPHIEELSSAFCNTRRQIWIIGIFFTGPRL
jgi:hypothetical protein